MMLTIFAISLLLGLLFSSILKKLGIVDKPDNTRKLHKKPTPPAGGLVLLPIYLYLIQFYPNYFSRTEVIFLLTLFLVGLLDDIFNLPVSIKLTVQLLGTFFISYRSNIPIYYILINTVFYAIYINSVNFIDNSSGTCLSFLIFSFLTLYLVTLNNVFIYFFSTMLALLLLNLTFERTFLGNNGSFFIGALLVVTIDSFSKKLFYTNESYFLAFLHTIKNLLTLFVPMVDFVFTTGRRILEGHSVFKADNRHLSFVLEKTFNTNYALIIWVLLLYTTFVFNIILIKDNIPYVHSASK